MDLTFSRLWRWAVRFYGLQRRVARRESNASQESISAIWRVVLSLPPAVLVSCALYSSILASSPWFLVRVTLQYRRSRRCVPPKSRAFSELHGVTNHKIVTDQRGHETEFRSHQIKTILLARLSWNSLSTFTRPIHYACHSSKPKLVCKEVKSKMSLWLVSYLSPNIRRLLIFPLKNHKKKCSFSQNVI
jgi:hypothetical protein